MVMVKVLLEFYGGWTTTIMSHGWGPNSVWYYAKRQLSDRFRDCLGLARARKIQAENKDYPKNMRET